MLAGLAYTLSHFARDRYLFSNLADDAQDSYASFSLNTVGPTAKARPIVFVDFDNATLARLNDPVLVPPEAVASVMRRLASTPPWAVLVDLDLSYVQDPDALAALTEGLTALTDEGSTILLARPAIDRGAATRYRSTPLDDLAARRSEIIWVSVPSSGSRDGVVRRFQVTDQARLSGRCITLPSAPLAVMLLDRYGSPARTRVAFARATRGQDTCRREERPAALRFPVHELIVRPTDNLIRYTFEWPPPAGLPRIGVGADSRPQIVRVGAGQLLAADGPIDPSRFRGALVVIGRTAGLADQRATPVGEMPGAYVLANATRAWLEFGPDRPRFWSGLVLVLLAALAVATTATLIIHRAGRWRPVVDILLPGAMSGLLWLVFHLTASWLATAGLFVTTFVVVMSVEIGHHWVDYLRHKRLEESR